MKEFQVRVVKEKEDLDDKLSRLLPFTGTELFLRLPIAEQERLKKQATIMQEYSNILEERIRNFE